MMSSEGEEEEGDWVGFLVRNEKRKGGEVGKPTDSDVIGRMLPPTDALD